MADRIAAIRSMLAGNPDDVFLHYSLGMEHAAAGNFDQAVQEFRRCVALDEDYLAAYVEAGKSLRSAGLSKQAREMFLAGLEVASARGERHVADFIRQQLG